MHCDTIVCVFGDLGDIETLKMSADETIFLLH
mgnify:CR=1 FL=1